MEKMTLLDSAEVCRRAALTPRQFAYAVRKFPDLLCPSGMAAGRYSLWDPAIVPLVLQCRTSMQLKTWEKRKAKVS